MSTHEDGTSPYSRALAAARALGRADGRLAVEIEPAEGPATPGSRCHGLDPEDLARLVWDAGAAPPPAGVVVNASHWYAQGFREALACARAQQVRRATGGARPAEHCRPLTGSRTPCAAVCVALPAPVAGTGAEGGPAGGRRRGPGGPEPSDHGRA